jgi:hypothetical protein
MVRKSILKSSGKEKTANINTGNKNEQQIPKLNRTLNIKLKLSLSDSCVILVYRSN